MAPQTPSEARLNTSTSGLAAHPAGRPTWGQLSTDPGACIADALKLCTIRLRRLQAAERKARSLPLVEVQTGGGEKPRRVRRRTNFDDIAVRLLRTMARLCAVAALTGALEDPEEHARKVRDAFDGMMRGPFVGVPDDVKANCHADN